MEDHSSMTQDTPLQTHRGRGALDNPPSRFDRLHFELNAEDMTEGESTLKTEYYVDTTKSILTLKNPQNSLFRAWRPEHKFAVRAPGG